MTDDPLLKGYLDKPLTQKEKARLTLLKFLIDLSNLTLIDLGLAGLVAFRSTRRRAIKIDKYLNIKNYEN